MMIYLYHIISFLLLPLYFILLFIRIIVGKEDIQYIGERFAIGKSRNIGFLILIHVASVGESFVALTLIENINNCWLKRIGINFLVTSSTLSSSKILRQKLPKNAIHQFRPIDNIIFIRKFLKNWHPDLIIFIESELWPCLISEGAKYCKLLLLSARISDKSFKSWQKMNFFFKSVIKNFSEIIVQSNVDFEKFQRLGVHNIVNLGNIKFANKKLRAEEQELLRLSEHLIKKRIIVMASTHFEDEQIILNVIKPLKKQYIDCYFILIPRHPERTNAIAATCTQLKLTFNIKSKTDTPLLNDDLYIVDKLGELGLFFSLAYITFIGGSFKQGGHNILEPAYFNNCIIFGPNMSNFANITDEMIQNGAATQIHNQEDLLNKLQYFMTESGSKEAKIYQANALAFIKKNQQILQNYLKIIEKYISHRLKCKKY